MVYGGWTRKQLLEERESLKDNAKDAEDARNYLDRVGDSEDADDTIESSWDEITKIDKLLKKKKR